MGLPRFAIKFVVSLSLTDCLFMAADVIASMISAGDTEQDVTVPAVASLASFMESFLSIEFNIDFALSLVDAPNGVPEWSGVPVRRGLFLNASAHAFFIGFEFDFRVLVELILPTPSLAELASTAAFFGSFFSDPMGLVTGKVSPPKNSIKIGFEIEAECSLPLDLGYAYFFGAISLTQFRLDGNAWLAFPGAPMYAYLSILAEPPDPPRTYLPNFQLDFGGELQFGPFGYVSTFGSMRTQPEPYFAVKGSFCMALIGPFVFSGSLAVCFGPVPDEIREWCEYSNSVAFEARTMTGFLGEWHVKGLLAFDPFVMRASVELRVSFADMIGELIDFILKVITGTANPEKSPVSKALKTLFQLANFITGGKVSIDTSISLLELTVYLNLLGTEVPLSLPLPLPFRRRYLEQLEEGLLTKSEGELADPNGWPHPDDPRLNATRRRAEGGACAGIPSTEMTIEDIMNQIGEFFSNPMKIIETIAPIDFSFAFDISFLGLDVAGSLRFQLEKSGYMQLDLSASMSFLGIGVEGELSLSTTGGLLYAYLKGTGGIPKLCDACPELKGVIELVKPRDSKEFIITMATSLEIGCMRLDGSARFSTEGGLESMVLNAENPLCFLELLKDFISDFVPGASLILSMITLKVHKASFAYNGVGGSITFELEIGFSDDPTDSTLIQFMMDAPVSGGGDGGDSDLTDMLSLGTIMDLLDPHINIFSLTFIDTTVGGDPETWDALYGDRDMGGSGQGAGAEGALQLDNSAYMRVGLFGAAFGLDLDNFMWVEMFHSGKNHSLIDAVLALKVDVQIKNPIAADLANMISDLARTVIEAVIDLVKDVLSAFGVDVSTPTLNKDALRVVVTLRNAVCILREAFDEVLESLDNELGAMGEPNKFSIGVPAIINSISLLLHGVEIAIKRGEVVRDRMPEFERLGSVIDRILEETSDYFRNPQIIVANNQISEKIVTLRDMLADADSVPKQAGVLITALTAMLDVLTVDEASQLESLANWGIVVRNVRCLLKKAPDFSNRLAALDRKLPVTVFGALDALGRDFIHSRARLPVLQAAPPAAVAAFGANSRAVLRNENLRRVARTHFASFDFYCEPVQALLIRLVSDLGTSELFELNEFKMALEQRRFPFAAELLQSRCTQLSNSCDDDVAVLLERCPVSPAWSKPPTWRVAGYTQSSSEIERLEVEFVRTESSLASAAGGRTYHTATLEIDLVLTVYGRASCSTILDVELEARLVQRGAQLIFFSEQSVTNELVQRTASELYIRPDGMLAVQQTTADRWWLQHSSLFADAAVIDDLRGRVRHVCATGEEAHAAVSTNSSVKIGFDIELQLNESEPLFRPTISPAAQTLVLAGLSKRPWQLRWAPGPVCYARCDPGLTPTPFSTETSALPRRMSYNPATRACFDYLWRDYSNCYVEKDLADTRLTKCLRAKLGVPASDDLSDLAPLALRVLHASGASANDTAALLQLLDCETFTTAKAQHCACLQGVPLQVHSMRTLEGDVGRLQDPTAASRPADRTSVRERLWGLGYGQGSFSLVPPADSCENDIDQPPSTAGGPGFVSVDLQDHLSRVFLCAAAGAFAFEDQCDVQRINGNCAVNGVECPRPARTSRQTCLRLTMPCTQGSFRVGSTEHDWLRAHAAPAWIALPHSGDGYELEQGSAPYAFGTSWLTEALVMAGRYLWLANQTPLRVFTVSGREGGRLPDEEEHQTGLQITLKLPVHKDSDNNDHIDWTAVQAQVLALERAGFEHIQLKGDGAYATCLWRSSLCRGSQARVGQMNALVNPPALLALAKLPSLTGASLERSNDKRSALLFVQGNNLGTSLEDIMEVAVGAHRCAPTSIVTKNGMQNLTAWCASPSLVGSVHGVASVMTASGGQGIGIDFLEVLLKPEHRPLPPPAPPSPPTAWEGSATERWATPPSVEVPGDNSNVGVVYPIEPPITISALRELQGMLHGANVPVCHDSAPSAPSIPPAATSPVKAPPPVLPYPASSAQLQVYHSESALAIPLDREPSSLSPGNCSANVAHQVFDACSALLIQPLFPINDNDTWAVHLLLNARPELGVGSHSLGSTAVSTTTSWGASHAPANITCPVDVSYFLGDVPVPGQTTGVPFKAAMPRAGGLTDPASGLPQGLLIEVGAFTIDGGLSLWTSEPLRVALTTVAFGRADEIISSCREREITPQHRAMVEVWAPGTATELHALLDTMLSFRLPESASAMTPYGELAMLTAPLKITIVKGDPMEAGDARALSVPLHLRGKASGMHISASSKLLAGPPRQLACMVSWIAKGMHPCKPQPVFVDVFLPTETIHPIKERLGAILRYAHLTTILNTTSSDSVSTTSLGPYFLASVGQATLRIDDLRPVEINRYNERVTQLSSLNIDQLTIRLPIRADCNVTRGGWLSPFMLSGISAEFISYRMTNSQMSSLSKAYPTSIRADATHDFVRLSRRDPQAPNVFRPLSMNTGQPWAHPLGTNLSVEGMAIELIYSVVHPVAALEGPSICIRGLISLMSGTLFELTVQIDRSYALGGATQSTVSPGHTGLYLMSPSGVRNPAQLAYMDGMDAIDLFLKVGSLPVSTIGVIPEAALRQLTLDTNLLGCLAATDIWFHPSGRNAPASFSCSAGFHITASGSAWGIPVQVNIDAQLAEPVSSGFVFQDLRMMFQMTEPSDLTEVVRSGVNSIVGPDTFIDNCALQRAQASFSFTQDLNVALDIHGFCTYQNFSISMRVNLEFGTYNVSSVSANVQRAWPSQMALDVHADLVSLHDVMELFLSTYLPAEQRAPVLNSRLSPGFRFIFASQMRGCIAGSDMLGFCHGGAHAQMPIGASHGFFGVEADAYVTSPAYSAEAGIGPLQIVIIVRPSALTELWSSVYEGILDAVGERHWAGMAAILERVMLASIRLESTSNPSNAANGTLNILLNDRVRCGNQIVLTLPLSAFESRLWADQAFTPRQLQTIVGELNVAELLRSFSNGQDITEAMNYGLYFNATERIPAAISTELSMDIVNTTSLIGFIVKADVCKLGLVVEQLEIKPPSVTSELCAAVVQWRERAEVLRASLLANATCGAHFANVELGQLRLLEERLGALRPADMIASCLQVSSLLAGVRSAIELPSESLRRNLYDLERMLQGMELVWTAGSDDITGAEAAQLEVLLLVPSTLERVRQTVVWQPVARHLANSVRRVAGVLDFDRIIDAGGVMSQLQQWGSTLQSVIETLPPEVPDVGSVFESVKLKADHVVRKIDSVSSALGSTESLISQAFIELRSLESLVSILNPESVEKAKMRDLSKINFDHVDELLDTAKDYLLDNHNLLLTMWEHRVRLDAEGCATSIDNQWCDIPKVRSVIAVLREILSPRKGSPRQILNDFPPLIAEHVASLEGDLKEDVEDLYDCTIVLSDLVNRMPTYVDAIDEMIAGPAHRVDLVSKAFFVHLDAMEASLDKTVEAINHVRNGKPVTDALQSAGASLSTASHGALLKKAVKLINFFRGFVDRLLPETFTMLVPFISNVLVPAAETVKQLERYLLRKRYVDHLLKLPTDFLTQLLTFDNRRGSMPQPVSLVPSVPAMDKATQVLFDELPSLEDDLADLLLPSSTCLAKASCQADLQIKVRKVRGSARALQQKLQLLPKLATSLREPLIATVDLMGGVRTLLPDLELMSAWATATSGPIPAQNPASSIVQPPVLRQLTGALCKELELRSAQGRPTQPPFKLELPCNKLGSGYEDAPNAMAISVEQTAESWTLWQKLASTMRFIKGELSAHRDAMREQIAIGREMQSEFKTSSESFATSFNDMLLSFGMAFYLQANMSTVFTLEAAIISAEVDTVASMSIWDMRDLGGSAEATLRRSSQATSDPWSCADAPRTCEEVPPLAMEIEASHDELLYDMSTPELTVPVTLLTGTGDAICDFYGGIKSAYDTLSAIRHPMEALILKYLQGPDALNGDTPACKPGDRFCLTTAARGDEMYRRITYSLFFLHFWSLCSPPKYNLCGTHLKWRFTIPGLWSAVAMQTSTFLAFRQKTEKFVIKCAQFLHLLAYSPAVPGGCTDMYQSFFAGIDMAGNLAIVYPISLPNGEIYAGTLTGVAVSPPDEALWACGREDENGPWYLFSFDLRPMQFGWDKIEKTEDDLYPEHPIRMCHRKKLPDDLRVINGKEKCMVSFDAKRRWLWVGNLAQEKENGHAWAYDLQNIGTEWDRCITTSDYTRKEMKYGKHVSAFSFLTDVLGDDYVGIGRCDNFNRVDEPCAMEFYEVDRNREDMDLTAMEDPGTVIRVPQQIGNLVHDSSLGVPPEKGGYFHLSFVGMTPENVDKSLEYGYDPEDRIFTVRTPFLSTGIRKRVDEIALSIGGAEIIAAGTKIIPESWVPTKPPDPECATPEDRAKGCADMGTITTRRRRRQLQRGRNLFDIPMDSEGCMDLSVYLVNQTEGGVSVTFDLSLGPVGSIKGYFRIAPTLVLGLPGKFCMMDMEVKLGLDIQIGIEGAFELEAEILIFRGGLSLEGSVLGLSFEPGATIELKEMEVKPVLMFGMKLIDLAMKCWFQTRLCIKWCCSKTFLGKICLPCGFNWCDRKDWDFGRITLGGDGKKRDLLKILCPDCGDKTPPERGDVKITQINSKQLSARFGNFTERDSEIYSTTLVILMEGEDEVHSLHRKFYEGEAESWSGKLDRAPIHGRHVAGCVTAMNTAGLQTTVCSPPIIWDSMAPVVKEFYTVNPFTTNWRKPECAFPCIYSEPPVPFYYGGWAPGLEPVLPCPATKDLPCTIWTNVTRSLRFAVRLRGFPANEPATKALWALSEGAPCRSRGCPEGKLVTRFVPMGYPARLQAGDYFKPVLDVQAGGGPGEDLGLVSGKLYYINVHCCDFFDNCATSGHTYPIRVDDTPPLPPIKMLADRLRVTAANGVNQHWISATRIDPVFVFDGGGDERDANGKSIAGGDLVDPESGIVEAFINLYKLRPRHPGGREMLNRYYMSKRTEGGRIIRSPPYVNVNSKLHYLPLELGQQYVVQLVQVNQAGGYTKWISDRITADWTTPVCTTPKIVVEEDEPIVAPFDSLPGSSPYFGTRVATWVRSTTTSISVDVDHFTCEDPESMIFKTEMWVGSKHDGVDDIIPVQEVQLGTVHKLPISPNLNLKDRMYCKQCGDDIVVGVRCINRANVSRVCRPYAVVRVDGSPPGCVGVQPLLGQGLRPGFQSSRNNLLLSKLRDAGMEDKETGIKLVEYSLIDVASVDATAALSGPLSLPWLEHEGLPLSQKMGIQGISLLHGHTYRVEISLTNYIGLNGSCLTNAVLIDATPPTEGVVLLLQHDKDNEAVMPVVNFFQYRHIPLPCTRLVPDLSGSTLYMRTPKPLFVHYLLDT